MKRIKITKLSLSEQAAQRLQRRGLSLGDLGIVLRFGRKIHRAGETFYFFGRRQIPAGCERELERLIGTTVLVADGRIITVYRHRRAIGKIKKRRKKRGAVKKNKSGRMSQWENGKGRAHSPVYPLAQSPFHHFSHSASQEQRL